MEFDEQNTKLNIKQHRTQTKQNKQSTTKQNKTKQNKTKQNKTSLNKTKPEAKHLTTKIKIEHKTAWNKAI